MRKLWMLALVIGCGGNTNTRLTAADCDHVWGQPSGYMASACCRSQHDCDAAGQAQYFCTTPDTALAMGVCPQSDCTMDSDCRTTNPTAICNPLDCDFPNGMCAPGCTGDTACPDAQACDLATNHCRAKSCTQASDCPINFLCASGACMRDTCTKDADCSGFCVIGRCFETAGECRGPVA